MAQQKPQANESGNPKIQRISDFRRAMVEMVQRSRRRHDRMGLRPEWGEGVDTVVNIGVWMVLPAEMWEFSCLWHWGSIYGIESHCHRGSNRQ